MSPISRRHQRVRPHTRPDPSHHSSPKAPKKELPRKLPQKRQAAVIFGITAACLVRPAGFEPVAYRVGVIRPSSRKALQGKGLVGVTQISAILKKNLGSLIGQGFRGFSRSSQIVVWIKCGFSSPVQLNIFTLYPWIRSAASHPSTLARSSTIPACAFASSYCFCS